MADHEGSLGQSVFPSGSDSSSFGESGVGYFYQQRAEGYDYEFVPVPDTKYECVICLLILREPRQTKCGHRFCRDCITRWLRESEARCPVDNEAIAERDLFADNFAKREILNFNVKCPNYKQGCELLVILRKLKEHTDICALALIPCPNQCLDVLLRRDVPSHVQFNCHKRRLLCDYCQKDVISDEMESHILLCPMVKTRCQFCDEEFTKHLLKEHHDTDCPKFIVSCDCAPLGCTATMERGKEVEHYTDAMVRHQRMLCKGVVRLLRHSNGDSLRLTDSTGASNDVLTDISAVGSVLSKLHHLNINPERGDTASHNQLSPASNPSPVLDQLKTLATSQSLDMDEEVIYSSKPSSETVRVSYTSKPSDVEGLKGGYFRKQISGSDLASFKYQNLSQDESLVRHEQALMAVQGKIDMLEKSQRELKSLLHKQQIAMEDAEARFCNGQYYWRIDSYQQLRLAAEQGVNSALHSPSFCSSPYGYKLCIRANLNGVDTAKGSHISIFIHFMQSEWDDVLVWPFSGKIILSIIDQNPACELRRHITETLIAKPHLAAFQRPSTPRNHKGFGYMEFALLCVLDNASFIRDDCLIIKAEIHSAT